MLSFFFPLVWGLKQMNPLLKECWVHFKLEQAEYNQIIRVDASPQSNDFRQVIRFTYFSSHSEPI